MKSKELLPFIKELLLLDKKVRLTVTGMSMYPFLRENIDSVELYQKDFSQINVGDIVLAIRENNEYVLHRVIRKKENSFYLIGDAQEWIEGPLISEQLIAVVSAVWRKSKRINCSSICWKVLTLLWLWIRPFRYFIIISYRKFRRPL